MQTQVVCECGNEVNVSAEHANVEYRCPRCGRRVFVDENDAKAFFDISSSVDGDYQTPLAGKHSSHLLNVPGNSPAGQQNIDPDATVVQSVFSPAHTAEKKANNIGGNSTIELSPAKQPPQDDGFDVTPQPVDSNSSIVWGGDVPTPKYDLSQRVMRPIARPVLPAIPYSGGGEYGIHRILRVHQRGGMGRILVAYDQYLKRDVAIKELHPDVAEDESIVRRFIGEAEITAQLEHPGVVPIHRLGQGHDGLPYYTMKMIKGDTLQDAIKAYHRKPSPQELLGLVRRIVSVAKTMAFAHSKGVIHRDLKPANIMLGEHGETLVMDWGLAKPFNQGLEDSYISIIHRTKQPRPELTMVGAIVGTPAFMSPEQAMAEENVVGPLSDVFSLGTILYYLLAGQTAFSGRSTQEVLSKVRAAVVTPPSQIKSNVPHGLEQICLKAMSKLPENRYQGAIEFADDLCRWLDGEPVTAEKISLSSKIQRWMRRHRSLVIGTPCALLLLVLFTCINVWIAGSDANTVTPVVANEPVFSEFAGPLQVEGSQGAKVWTEYRETGELLLSCQVEAAESVKHYVLKVYAPPSAQWNLTQRHTLGFSLLAIPTEGEKTMQNFSIRLGQGQSYCEYTPHQEHGEDRNLSQWQFFTIPLKRDLGDWKRNTVGTLDMANVEWLEIHFDSDSEIILNVDNLIFRGK